MVAVLRTVGVEARGRSRRAVTRVTRPPGSTLPRSDKEREGAPFLLLLPLMIRLFREEIDEADIGWQDGGEITHPDLGWVVFFLCSIDSPLSDPG